MYELTSIPVRGAPFIFSILYSSSRPMFEARMDNLRSFLSLFLFLLSWYFALIFVIHYIIPHFANGPFASIYRSQPNFKQMFSGEILRDYEVDKLHRNSSRHLDVYNDIVLCHRIMIGFVRFSMHVVILYKWDFQILSVWA